jgi:phage shock protein PspC (stress-responsive transcriptional regulator)
MDTTTDDTTTERPADDVDDRDDRLHRSDHHRMLAGVAGGLGEYFDVDPTLVRVGFVVLGLMGGLAVPLYLAGWLLLPAEGAEQSVAEELLARERLH